MQATGTQTSNNDRQDPISKTSGQDRTAGMRFDFVPCENLTLRVQAQGVPSLGALFQDSPYRSFFDELCRALHRSTPRHILLVRERGVGEQVVLLELAARGVAGTPQFLRGMQIIGMDCRFLPVEEGRPFIQTLFDQWGNISNSILCLDGFSTFLRFHGSMVVRSVLSSFLMRARCRIMGIVTPHEYEELVLVDDEFRELFSVIHLSEPQPVAACQIVGHFAHGLMAHYGVEIDVKVIQRAVVLSSSYILHERLPYKAVKVLRAICDDIAYDRSENFRNRIQVTEADVITKIAQLCNIPETTLAGVGESVDYQKIFSDFIVGQEHAIREVAIELGLIKSGFVDSGKPASVMMFIGQTGTGKTELAKVLARFYSSSKRLKTFTLGNFSEPHSVSGIIGVPPGYVGHEQGGRLVNELNADPYGVFLLDEADKAHPDVMQPFLNLFDEGWICDQRGVKAYADRAIFILTTNVGQRQISDMCKNGKSIEEITLTMKESLSRIRHTKSNRPVFTPEFLSRVKRMVVFRSLDGQAMLGICRRLVSDLQNDWRVKRQKVIQVPVDLIEAVARKAHAMDEKSQGKEGGRIVRKLLADIVDSKIQAAISLDPQAYRNSKFVFIQYAPLERSDPASIPAEAVEVRFGFAEGA